MRKWQILGGVLAATFTGAAWLWAGAADEPAKPANGGPLVVIDAAGKEQKLKAWKFVAGTRPLSWLAPAPPKDVAPKDAKKEDAPKAPPRPAGPVALELREENSTNFVNGILTLVPLDRIRSIDYDEDSVTVHVATSNKPDKDVVLKGSTKYRGINKIVIEAEVDKGDLGVAELKFLGGVPKGIKGLRFPAPKPATSAAPTGRVAVITIADKGAKEPVEVADLKVLYRFPDGSQRTHPQLFFRKTLKIDLAKIDKLKSVDTRDGDGTEYTVALKGGTEETLTLLKTVALDGKQATLEGVVGRIGAGYKLFPLHTIAELQFKEEKADKGEPKP